VILYLDLCSEAVELATLDTEQMSLSDYKVTGIALEAKWLTECFRWMRHERAFLQCEWISCMCRVGVLNGFLRLGSAFCSIAELESM
jgi:hypothetical protein